MAKSLTAKYGPIWGMSGITNFFNDGYPYHKVLKLIPGFTFKGMTFVAKTTTLNAREGLMPLNKKTLMPKEIFPKSIYVHPLKEIALNAVSLSGPGTEDLLKRDIWQQMEHPFFISFMSVEKTDVARNAEFESFQELFCSALPFSAKHVGIQFNESCPNTGHAKENRLEEILYRLDRANWATSNKIDIVIKLSIETSPEDAKIISNHKNCAGLCVSNTIPFRSMRDKIKWDNYFGELPKNIDPDSTDWHTYKGLGGSPLVKRGVPLAGGLSGAPLLPLVADWIKAARKAGVEKHINAGGGILRRRDMVTLHKAGAESFSIGSVAFLRPHRLKKIIAYAHKWHGVNPTF